MKGHKASLDGRFGYNVIGFLTGNFGLSAAARNTVRLLDKRGFGMRLIDIDAGTERTGKDFGVMHMGMQTEEVAPYAVNLFHVNPSEVATLAAHASQLRMREKINLCVPFWELQALPTQWLPILAYMDAILTATDYIRDSILRVLPNAVCVPYPQATILPEGIEPNRAKFGLPDDAVVFLNVFDLHSDINRKNPLAVIEAFRRAFPKPENNYLVIKMSAVRSARELYPNELAEVHRVASETANMILIDELLTYEDVLSLHASCDVFVSLHRAEGLGLNLMESMSLGKATICTAWSGNMDFTNDRNSCLVGYKLIPVQPTHKVYDPANLAGEARWADPDVEEAAQFMQRLATDKALRSTLGQRAKADMEENVMRYWRGLTFDQVKQQAVDSSSLMWQKRRASGRH
ncbi:MAG: glycosyltransferase family 4 protein [Actinomycetota bacterium]|nr:glycosyltransferase family 4 protein [Actinomycetota bacterium]